LPEPAAPPLTLDDIDTGVSAVETVDGKGKLDLLEEHRIEEARLRNELARSHIDNINADREMRKNYASRILRYLEWYSGVVGIMIVGSGFSWTTFSLPNEIAATLVGSTAVAAIGLVGFIAQGLFKSPPPGSN
jgi:hypothetical protein